MTTRAHARIESFLEDYGDVSLARATLHRLAFPELSDLDPAEVSALLDAARARSSGLSSDPRFGSGPHHLLARANLRLLVAELERHSRPRRGVSAADVRAVLERLHCPALPPGDPVHPDDLREALLACPGRVVIDWRSSARDIVAEVEGAARELGVALPDRFRRRMRTSAGVRAAQATTPQLHWLSFPGNEASDGQTFLLVPLDRWAEVRDSWLTEHAS